MGASTRPKPRRWTDLVPIPRPDEMNTGLTSPSNAWMLQHLGRPRQTFSTQCQPVTHARLKRCIITADVGPFRVTGYDLVIPVFRAFFADVRAEIPDLYRQLTSAGMLCCRLVRGSTTAISDHSWGTALDTGINGVVDRRGDGKCYRGMLALYGIAKRYGLYWGAEYRVEDAMHFSASQQLLERLLREHGR